ncbi:MAG: ornithine cyclodeaminase family protein [Actinomycetota bacterium]|nr:MAG: ornithine cyclodeaminase family protein [Actinomycetota bacterium]
MVRYLRNEDIAQLISMPEVIEDLRKLYVEMGHGISVGTPRSDVHHPISATREGEDASDSYIGSAHYLKTMVGGYVGGGLVALRLSSDLVRFSLQNGYLRREKEPQVPGKWFGMVALFSLENGELKCLMQDGVIQRMRVGATSALADDLLARQDTKVIAILGSGGQARAHLRALSHVRKLERVQVWSPNAGHRKEFCNEMEEELGVSVVSCTSSQQAVLGCDLLMTATNSRQPFVDPEWLVPGMHVSALQRDEVSDDGYRRIDRLVLHTKLKEVTVSSSSLPSFKGTILQDHPVPSSLDWTRYPTLAEISVGIGDVRQSDEEITGFINNLGQGSQFAAVGSTILRKAEEKDLGIKIDSDLLWQNMHS